MSIASSLHYASASQISSRRTSTASARRVLQLEEDFRKERQRRLAVEEELRQFYTGTDATITEAHVKEVQASVRKDVLAERGLTPTQVMPLNDVETASARVRSYVNSLPTNATTTKTIHRQKKTEGLPSLAPPRQALGTAVDNIAPPKVRKPAVPVQRRVSSSHGSHNRQRINPTQIYEQSKRKEEWMKQVNLLT